jgi:replicative DNA helicase
MSSRRKVTSEILDRQPPSNLEAERGVLGSILLLPVVCDDVLLIVRPEDFYDDANRVLFTQIRELHDAGRRVDITLLHERLKTAGQYEAIGGGNYLAGVLQSVPTAANATHYARIVKNKATLRSLIHVSTEILRDVYSGSAEPGELLDQAVSKLDQLAGGVSAHTIVTAKQAVSLAIDRARLIVRNRQTPAIGTGLASVDRKIGGLFPGELVILGARPGVGKTALAAQIGIANAIDGRRVLFFSSEMDSGELALRTLCGRSGVSSNLLRSGRANDDHLNALEAAGRELETVPLLIDDRGQPSVSDIRHAARREHRKSPLALVIVDYLQRLAPADSRAPRHEQVSRMAEGLKTLARELAVPVLAPCQLNRGAENSADQKPRPANLRESGSIEAEADQIWFLHRPEVAKKDDPDLRGKAEFIVAKNRNGETPTIDLTWHGASTTFRDPDDNRVFGWDEAIDPTEELLRS